MKNPKTRKKKKIPAALAPIGGKVAARSDNATVVGAVTEAFSVASLNDSVPLSREARVGLDVDAESFDAGGFGGNIDDLGTTSSSSSSGITASCSSSYSSEDVVDYSRFVGKKQKRVIAATGTVSTVLGKDYVRSTLKRDSKNKFMEFDHGKISQQEAEQFLCSMLGDDCELSMGVVRDVLCEYR